MVVEAEPTVVVVTGAVVAVVGAVCVAMSIFWIVALDGLRTFAPFGMNAMVINEFSVNRTPAGSDVSVGDVEAKLGQ